MEIKIENVSDLPLLGCILKSSGIVELLDQRLAVHGNWKGPSFGQTLLGMLLYVISESDHRLYLMENWVKVHRKVLAAILDYPTLQAKHFNDDRLGIFLEHFSTDLDYTDFCEAHNGTLLHLYDLSPQIVHLDAGRTQSFRCAEGLFQKGTPQVNKRVDLVDIKTAIAAVEPLGFPMTSLIVAGNTADDKIYRPLLEKGWLDGMPLQHILYVGDTKLGNSTNFHFIGGSHNYYLCPLSLKQFSYAQLDAALEQMETQKMTIEQVMHSQLVATCDHLTQDWLEAKLVELTSEQMSDGKTSWTHRILLVQSEKFRVAQQNSLEQRVLLAQQQIEQRFIPCRGRKKLTLGTESIIKEFTQQVLKKYKVQDLLDITLIPPTDKKGTYQVQIGLHLMAYQQQQARCGWRAYATNTPIEQFAALQVLQCYRREYQVEQQFHYLMNKCTALKPVFLQKQERITAMIQILIFALKYISLAQYRLRQNLKKDKVPYLDNLVPGNKGRKVYQPTFTAVLRLFKNIYLIDNPNAEQGQIYGLKGHTLFKVLRLLNIDPNVYLCLCQRTRKILTET